MSKEIVLNDFAFLVSETDEKGIITFASDHFCEIAGYTIDELLGKPHNIIRHPDMPKSAFKDLWDTVKNGQIWTGYVKNLTKDGNFYWVYSTVYPKTMSGNKKTYLSCRKKASVEEINKYSSLYKTMV